jgi:hypothetical protein
MFAFTHETREQRTEEYHVVHDMEEVVKFRLDVVRVQFGEQLRMLTNEAAEPVYVAHGRRRSELQYADDQVEAPQTMQMI